MILNKLVYPLYKIEQEYDLRIVCMVQINLTTNILYKILTSLCLTRIEFYLLTNLLSCCTIFVLFIEQF